MTDIVETPAAPVVPPFPALGASNFNDDAYAFGAAMPEVSAGIHAIGVAAYINATCAKDAADAAVPAAAQAVAAADAAVPAAAQAVAAADAAVPAAAQALDAAQRAQDAAAGIADGPVTSVNGKTGVVNLAATDIAAQATTAEMQAGTVTAPRSMSPANVRDAVLAQSTLRRVERTSNVQLQISDLGKWIDITTAGTFAQTFVAASTLGDAWWCYLRNGGSGDITLDPNASELIDGLTSFVMYPGEVRLVQCDGVALRSIVLNAFCKTFVTSGNFIRPPGYQRFAGILRGGGGGGANGSSLNGYGGGGGGGGGAGQELHLRASSMAASEMVVIGSGGYSSGTGGESRFGDIYRATGGWGGLSYGDGGGGGTGGYAFPSGDRGSNGSNASGNSGGAGGGGGGGGYAGRSGYDDGSQAGQEAVGGSSGYGTGGGGGAGGYGAGGGGGAGGYGAGGPGGHGLLHIWGII